MTPARTARDDGAAGGIALTAPLSGSTPPFMPVLDRPYPAASLPRWWAVGSVKGRWKMTELHRHFSPAKLHPLTLRLGQRIVGWLPEGGRLYPHPADLPPWRRVLQLIRPV